MKTLFKYFILVFAIALFFIGADLFFVQQEAAVSKALKSHQHYTVMASLMTKLVKNLIEGQQTLVLYPENCVKDALQIMEEHHLQSVPVLASKEQANILGIVDALDIVALMLNEHTKDFEKGYAETKEFWQYQTHQFYNLPLTKVIDYSRKQPVQTIHQSATLRDAIDGFLVKTHRVAVVDDRNRFQGILTQSRVMEYLASFDSVQQIPGLNLEIALKYFVTSNVVTTQDRTLAWKSMQILRENDITSIALEDEQGMFFDVISASDIKILNKNLMDVFLKSSKSFVELRKKSDRPPIAIYTDNLTPTIEIIRTMNREKVHRVFILKDHKACGVVSMTDVLKQISKETAL